MHNLTTDEYREEFPEAPQLSDVLLVNQMTSHGTMPHWEKPWSREYVLDRMREWVLRGQAMNHVAIEHVDKALWAQVCRRFGSWDEVLKFIGLIPEKVRLSARARRLTAEEVIQILRQRHAAGEALNHRWLRSHDARLVNAMRRRFGSERKALRAAGINPGAVRMKASPCSKRKRANLEAEARRVAALKGRARYEAARRMHRRYADHVYARWYGNWRKVAEIIGVPVKRLWATRFPYLEAVDEWYDDLYGNEPKPTTKQVCNENNVYYGAISRWHGSVVRYLESRGRARPSRG